MENNKAGLIGLSVALLVIGLIAGYAIGKNGSGKVANQAATPTESSSWQTYKNEKYGFVIHLPPDWKGYGVEVRGNDITLHHPVPNNCGVSDGTCRKIPIVVYTYQEWDAWVPGAAPISKEDLELGRNTRYVFATPPRWYCYDDNFATQDGCDEALAEAIIKTFQAF